MTLTSFNQTLSQIALYEQASAHLEKQGQPVSQFLQDSLARMYLEITPFLRKFVAKELGVLG